MIEETVQEKENFDFCSPEKQTLEGLRYNMQLYYNSVMELIKGKKPKELDIKERTKLNIFINYLNRAFERAEKLGVSCFTIFSGYSKREIKISKTDVEVIMDYYK